MILFLCVFSSVLFCCLVVVSTMFYLSARGAFVLQQQNQELEGFINNINGILEEDVQFLLATINKNFSSNIPEIQQLNSGLQKLRNDIITVKTVIEGRNNKD